jgi:hypothetical protein
MNASTDNRDFTTSGLCSITEQPSLLFKGQFDKRKVSQIMRHSVDRDHFQHISFHRVFVKLCTFTQI